MAKSTTQASSGSVPLKDAEQELFCVLYTSNTTPHFFGHGQNCYAEAYGHQKYIDALEQAADTPKIHREEVLGKEFVKRLGQPPAEMSFAQLMAKKKAAEANCRSIGSRLLTKVNIKERCAHLLDSFLKHEVIDREMAFTAMQRRDLPSKMMAIKEYNTVRKRVSGDEGGPKQKVEVEFKWQDPEPRPAPTSKAAKTK